MLQQVIFKLGKESYGLDITGIYSIERYKETTHIPLADTYVKGMVNLRDEVLVIYNLSERLGIEEGSVSEETRIIVAKVDDKKIGFIADEVSEIISVDDDMVLANIQNEGLYDPNIVKSIIYTEKGLISVLNLEHVLNH